MKRSMTVKRFHKVFCERTGQGIDGLWYGACTSTRIYCRPTCRVHPPKEENVRVFRSPAEAELAGFRPCLLCCPERAPHLPVPANDPSCACASLIEEHLAQADCLETVYEMMEADEAALAKDFKQTFGCTPKQYLETARYLLAKTLLSQTNLEPAEVAHACGIENAQVMRAHFEDNLRLDFDKLNEAGTKRPLKNPAVAIAAGTPRSKAGAAPEDAFTVSIGYREPFRFDLIANFLDFRAIKGVEVVRDGVYARTCALGDDHGWIAVSDDPAKRRLLLSISRNLAPRAAVLIAKARRLFDTDCDPVAVTKALKPFWKGVDKRYRIEGIRVPCSFSAFEMSMRAVIGQQITVKAANTLAGRIAAEFGQPCTTPFEGLDTVFPPMSAFATEEAVNKLGELGVIHQRANAIKLLAEGLADGSIRLHVGCDVAASMKALVALPGIGPWTANYIAMRAMHFTDGFPAADYGVKVAFPGMKPREIERLSEAWRPYRSYATMCTWCPSHDA